MNKGLTSYHKIKRAVEIRELCLAVLIVFIIFACLTSYTVGRIQGWNKAEYFTEKNIEKALIQAAAEGHDFRLRNISVKFSPRADGETIMVSAVTPEKGAK